jgi:hypothetical protein
VAISKSVPFRSLRELIVLMLNHFLAFSL